VIASNLALLTEEVLGFCRNNAILLSTSLGPIAHLGEHSPFIRGKYPTIVIVNERAKTNTRRATEVNVTNWHIGE
jgi:hypothetical protein